MTERQQAIIALFNTKDAANIEIAQECAISTGLGRWFSRYIDNLIVEIMLILEADSSIEISIYRDYEAYYIDFNTENKRRLLASALAFFVFNLRDVNNIADNFRWCEYVIFDNNEGYLQVTFDYDFYNTIAELKSLGCCFNEI